MGPSWDVGALNLGLVANAMGLAAVADATGLEPTELRRTAADVWAANAMGPTTAVDPAAVVGTIGLGTTDERRILTTEPSGTHRQHLTVDVVGVQDDEVDLFGRNEPNAAEGESE